MTRTGEGAGRWWAVCRDRARPGSRVTRFDLCHLHVERGAAEACGSVRPGVPELVAVERDTNLPRVFRVLWSLSHAAGGRLRLAQVGETGGDDD